MKPASEPDSSSSQPTQKPKTNCAGLIALFGGASAIALAPIFVRIAETGPTATAFYRIFFAQPILWAWILFSPGIRSKPGASNTQSRASHSRFPARKWLPWFMLAGFMFALDMGFWHASIHKTTLANSTLIANAAPLFVIVGARLFFNERIHPGYFGLLVMAGIGMSLLVKANLSLGGPALIGDICALITAFFYGGYQLCVKFLRTHQFGAFTILAYSGISAFAILLVGSLAMGEEMRIATSSTAYALIGLALVSHIGGQGLIVYAFGHLPASLASISLLLQPIMVIILGWVLEDEAMDLIQILGALLLLASLYFATRISNPPPSPDTD